MQSSQSENESEDFKMKPSKSFLSNQPEEIYYVPHSESITSLVKVDQNNAIQLNFTIFISHNIALMDIIMANNSPFWVFIVVAL